jgi:molecular chaperone GrpE
MEVILMNKNMKNCKKCKELEKRIEQLALSIDRVEDEKLIIKEQLIRALADYDNLVKNSEKRNEIKYFQLRKSLSQDILTQMDSLALAIESSKGLKLTEEVKSWLGGIVAIFNSMKKVFEDIGLKQYLPVRGDKFDPTIHEALSMIDKGKSGEIYDLIQPGYILDSTVIRPARVVVSK